MRYAGLIGALLGCVMAVPAWAETAQIAVAANFTATAEQLVGVFEAQTGHQLRLSFGATGLLYSQIAQGAPFDVLLAADAERPARAVAEGLGMEGSVFTYAIGALALFSTTRDVSAGAEVLKGAFDKLAIADPAAAPYGQAAVDTLTTLGLFEALQAKLVMGENIGQALQFVQTGNAELGFVALSQVAGQENVWVVPDAFYEPIRQDAVLLRSGADNAAANAFLAFLRSADAVALIEGAVTGWTGERTVSLTDLWSPISLSLLLAGVTTAILLVLGTPLAWWLARSRRRGVELIAAVVTLPLVLPPTVLGFYLLLVLGPQGPGGSLAGLWGERTLAFSFPGLVIGSVISSLPFMIAPLRGAFAEIGREPLEAALCLGASSWQRFWRVAVPLARHGYVAGAVLSFAHTVGEFGVVLMIGGNIPGQTKVLSIAIYDFVERLEWQSAHLVAAGMVIFALLAIVATTRMGRHRSETLP